MSGIRGSAQLLRNKLSSENLREYTDIVIKQTDRLTSLVDNILGPNKKPDFKYQNIHYPIENVLNLISGTRMVALAYSGFREQEDNRSYASLYKN